MKKVIGSITVASLLIVAPVHAQVHPETVVIERAVVIGDANEERETETSEEEKDLNPTYKDKQLMEFIHLFQEAVMELTEDEREKLTLLVEFASTASNRLEELIKEDRIEEAAFMLERYQTYLEEFYAILSEKNDQAKELDKDDELLEDLEEIVKEKQSMRGDNLRALLEREDLPSSAKAGIKKALANQEKAMENRQKAKERKEERKAEKEMKKEEHKAKKEEHKAEKEMRKEERKTEKEMRKEEKKQENQHDEKKVKEEIKEEITPIHKEKKQDKEHKVNKEEKKGKGNSNEKANEKAREARGKND